MSPALTVAPIDREQFDRLRETGRVDPEAEAGYRRGQIERTVGATISPELRDSLWTTAQRTALRRFTDILDDPAILKLADAKEDSNKVRGEEGMQCEWERRS